MNTPEKPLTHKDLKKYKEARRAGDLSMSPAELPTDTPNEKNIITPDGIVSEETTSSPEVNPPAVEKIAGDIAVNRVVRPIDEPKSAETAKPSETETSPKRSIFGRREVTSESSEPDQKIPPTISETATRVHMVPDELGARPQAIAPDLMERPKTVPKELPNRRGTAPVSRAESIVENDVLTESPKTTRFTVYDGGKSSDLFMSRREWDEFAKEYKEPNPELEDRSDISMQGPLLFEPPASGKTGSAS